MNILITSWYFWGRSGAELYGFELAVELKRRGHRVAIYAVFPGRLAKQAQALGIEVCGRAEAISFVPDIIHGHHQAALADAMLVFRSSPAIFVLHDANSPNDEPVYSARVRRYVAVDQRCMKRLAAHSDIPSHLKVVLYNFVNLERFKLRAPLPSRPKRALIFSNYARPETHLPAILAGCMAAGLPVDVVGVGVGNGTEEPENILSRYDIVFAKARCAIEAMATGNAVILCDFAGLGEMVMPENFDDLRAWNFGGGRLTRPLDATLITNEIARFDAAKSMEVAMRIRAEAGLVEAVDSWERLYNDVLRETESRPQFLTEDRAVWRRCVRNWRSRRLLQKFILLARRIRALPFGEQIYELGRRTFHKLRGN